MPTKLRGLPAKILAHIEAQHCGSGDVELEDAIDPVDYLCSRFGANPAAFADLLRTLYDRLDRLDTTWATTRATPATSMPPAPAGGVTQELWLSPQSLGFSVESCIKGKSKSIRIMECIEDFLAEPYASARSPLNILAPWGPPTAHIANFSVRHRIGFGKSLSCQLILLAVVDMKLKDSDLSSIQHLLQPLYVIKAVWEGSGNIKDEVAKTIKGKMQASEVKRLDPIQVSHAFTARSKEEGVPYEVGIDTFLAEYREEATGTQSISDLEEKVIKIIPGQTEALRRKLAYHWQNFKVAESGVPLSFVTNDAWLYGTKAAVSSVAASSVAAPNVQGVGPSDLWLKILAVTPEKRQFCIQRRMGIFLKGLKDATRLRKRINLKVSAKGFRCRLSDEVAYEIAALFCHFAPDFQRVLTPSKWAECLNRFFRGQFDTEMAEKVAHKDPSLTVDSFRFLALFGAKLAERAASSVASAEKQESEALLAKERSDMAWVMKQLQSEVSKWNDYKERVQQWQCTNALQRGSKIATIEEDNAKVMNDALDLRCPAVEIEHEETLAVHQNSCAQAWAEKCGVPFSDLVQVYWVDFTIPGYNFNRSALTALSKMAEALSANPELIVGIVLAPNTGPFGAEYSDEGIRTSQDEVKKMLDDSSLKCRYRDFDLFFDPAEIPKQSHRPGKHLGWIVVSDAVSPDGQLRALAAKCILWIRRCVVMVPFMHQKDYVNPLNVGRGHVNPAKDFSVSQKRKQWLAGWKLCQAVLSQVWSGMNLPDHAAACIQVMYAYDSSMVEQALRTSSSVPFQCVCQVAWADLDSDVHVTKPNSRIIKWLKASNKRVMQRLLMDTLFFLDGWERPEAGSHGTPRPTYAETDFKVICPVASGHLPVRKEWQDMMMQKYTNELVRTELQELIAEHNKIHNPSGDAHDSTASNKRSASSAGLDAGRQSHATKLPEDPGAPKNEAELAQADGPLNALECQGQKLYFTKSGHL